MALINLKRYREAIEVLDRALSIDPGNANALYRKGLSLSLLGTMKRRYDALRKHSRLIPRLLMHGSS